MISKNIKITNISLRDMEIIGDIEGYKDPRDFFKKINNVSDEELYLQKKDKLFFVNYKIKCNKVCLDFVKSVKFIEGSKDCNIDNLIYLKDKKIDLKSLPKIKERKYWEIRTAIEELSNNKITHQEQIARVVAILLHKELVGRELGYEPEDEAVRIVKEDMSAIVAHELFFFLVKEYCLISLPRLLRWLRLLMIWLSELVSRR